MLNLNCLAEAGALHFGGQFHNTHGIESGPALWPCNFISLKNPKTAFLQNTRENCGALLFVRVGDPARGSMWRLGVVPQVASTVFAPDTGSLTEEARLAGRPRGPPFSVSPGLWNRLLHHTRFGHTGSLQVFLLAER